MSDPSTAAESSDRIIKWREERLKVAETEKAARIAARDAERSEQLQRTREEQMERARALLPSSEELSATKEAMLRSGRSRRRNSRVQFLLAVVAPVLACFLYLTTTATPLYEARSVIAITKAGGQSDIGGAGLLGAAATPAHLQEVFMAHEYVGSKALMEALETELGLLTQLSSDAIDPLRRIRMDTALPISEQTQFSRFVESSVNVQTGMITLFVRMPTEGRSVEVSGSILGLVAEQINTLNDDLLRQRLNQAEVTVTDAQSELQSAQEALVQLQIESGEVDPRVRVSAIYSTIQQLETEAMRLNTDLQRAEIAGRGETFLSQQTQELEARVRDQIGEQRALLVDPSGPGNVSLNSLLMQYELAELRVRLAEERVTTSLVALAEAGQAAALGRSVFQIVVPPRTSTIATYPNTPSIMLVVVLVLLAVFVFLRLLLAGRSVGLT